MDKGILCEIIRCVFAARMCCIVYTYSIRRMGGRGGIYLFFLLFFFLWNLLFAITSKEFLTELVISSFIFVRIFQIKLFYQIQPPTMIESFISNWYLLHTIYTVTRIHKKKKQITFYWNFFRNDCVYYLTQTYCRNIVFFFLGPKFN